MRLLLTSNGICNQAIADALVDLVDKPAKEIKIGFIPTAVDGEHLGNKSWFIEQLTDLQKFGFTWIDIAEIAAPGVDWKATLDAVDAVYAGGGNPYYLLDTMQKVGFNEWLKANLDKKVFVGASAGAIVFTPSIGAAQIKSYSSKNVSSLSKLEALNLVDFELGPHIPDWPTYDEAEEYAKTISNKFYAIDNETAIKVVDGKIEITAGGKWKVYND